jgi:hypothetical protein
MYVCMYHIDAQTAQQILIKFAGNVYHVTRMVLVKFGENLYTRLRPTGS